MIKLVNKKIFLNKERGLEMVTIKSKSEIEKMREAGRIANLAQKAVERAIKP